MREFHVSVGVYEYVGFQKEDGVKLTDEEIEEVFSDFRRVKQAAIPKPINEMPSKDFIELYEKVRRGVPIEGDPGIMEKMSPLQSFAVNELKKSNKRNKK